MRVSWTPLGRGTSHLIGSEQGESGPMPRVREPGSVTAGEFAGESAVEVGTRVVQADDLHVLATLGVLRPDGVQRGDGGGVPDVGGGQVDDDLVGVACVVEPADEVVGGGEEQLAGDGVDDAGDDRERDRSGISASATTRPASTSVRQTFGRSASRGAGRAAAKRGTEQEKAREQVPVVSRAPPWRAGACGNGAGGPGAAPRGRPAAAGRKSSARSTAGAGRRVGSFQGRGLTAGRQRHRAPRSRARSLLRESGLRWGRLRPRQHLRAGRRRTRRRSAQTAGTRRGIRRHPARPPGPA